MHGFSVWISGFTLFALVGCGPTMVKPAQPPSGKALLKMSVHDPSGTYHPCAGVAIVCSINGVPSPDDNNVGWPPAYERNNRGTTAVVFRHWILEPGHQTVAVEWGDAKCGEEPAWRKHLGAFLVGGAIGLAISTGTHNDEDPVPPLLLEFDAEPGKSYVADCDEERTPWLWVTPEELR